MSRLALLCLALLGCCSHVIAQPSLTKSLPQAVVSGKTTELKLHGAKLTGPLKVWTSFPATAEVTVDPKVANVVTCKLTLANSVGAQVGGIVVGNASGTSDTLFVMVDDLPSIAEASNNTLATAQSLTLPVAVDGTSNGSAPDHYKFTAKAKQVVSVEVLAQRLGSSFDPVVRLFNPAGKEVLLADDDEALGPDCRFSYTCPVDGEYVLAVADNKFAAGGRYRLRVGDFPIVTTPYPLAARRGSTTSFTFAGVGPTPSRILNLGGTQTSSLFAVNGRVSSGKSSALGSVMLTNIPQVLEMEPNDQIEQATRVTMPSGVNGRFEKANDVDTFEFAALKGQRLTFDAVTRSAGSPSIVSMRVLKPDGGALGATKVSDDDEPSLSIAIPADGTYRLIVEELLRRGGPTHTYHVAVRLGPTFDLSIKNDAKLTTKFLPYAANGAFTIDVQCGRLGYDGPIQIEFAEDAPGLTLINSVVAAKAKSHRVIIAVAADAKPGDMHVIKLRGRSTDPNVDAEALVSSRAFRRVKTPLLSYPPAWMTNTFGIAISAPGKPLFSTAFDKPSVQLAPGGKIEVAMKLTRIDKNFKTGITIIRPALPRGVSYAVKAEKDIYKVTITASNAAAVGKHTLTFRSYGDVNNRGQIHNAELPLEITKPASVATTK